ncbi:TPA: hypothetical protein ACH3X3_001100 [Trebouxia sp. C0006]
MTSHNQLQAVKQEVEKVCAQIDKAEGELAKAKAETDNKEVDFLRNTLVELHRKENTLLEQKTILLQVQAPGLLTLKQVVSSPLQQLHARLSPRRSTSKTIPSAPRTFSDILSWPEFVSEACQLEGSLDDAIHQYALPTVTMQAATGISSAADESEVRGAIMSFLYSINEAAKLLGIGVCWGRQWSLF